MKLPSRIGTAPLRPANITKLFSCRPSPDPASSGSSASGRMTTASEQRRRPAPGPRRPGSVRRASVDGEPEHHEGDDLGEAGEGGVEVLDLALVRRPRLADQDPGDEHGQEPGAVQQRGHAEQRERAGQRPQRVEPLPGQRHPPHEPQQRPAAEHAHDRRPPTICSSELARRPGRRASPESPRPRAGWPSARCRPGRSPRTRPRGWCRCARRPPARRGRRTRPRDRSARPRWRPAAAAYQSSPTARCANRRRRPAWSGTCRRRPPGRWDARRPGRPASRCPCRRRRGSAPGRRSRGGRPSAAPGGAGPGSTCTAIAAAASIRAGAGTRRRCGEPVRQHRRHDDHRRRAAATRGERDGSRPRSLLGRRAAHTVHAQP